VQLFLRNLVVVDRLLLLDPALGLGAAVQTRLQINLLLLRGGQQVLLRQQDQAVLVRLSHLIFLRCSSSFEGGCCHTTSAAQEAAFAVLAATASGCFFAIGRYLVPLLADH